MIWRTFMGLVFEEDLELGDIDMINIDINIALIDILRSNMVLVQGEIIFMIETWLKLCGGSGTIFQILVSI